MSGARAPLCARHRFCFGRRTRRLVWRQGVWQKECETTTGITACRPSGEIADCSKVRLLREFTDPPPPRKQDRDASLSAMKRAMIHRG